MSAAPPVRRCRPWLGTFVEITARSGAAVEAGFAAVAAAHRLMSGHDPESDLSRLNRLGWAAPVALHPWTAAVLARALHWAQATDGAFDPTVGGRMEAAGLLPVHEGAPAPDPEGDWRDVELQGDTAFLRRPVRLDFGGLAKGFAVDRAVEAMLAAGARSGLVNAGGDLRAFGRTACEVAAPEPETRRPARRLRLRNTAAATSAVLPGRDGARHLPHRSRAYASATVIAPLAVDADALTKVVLAGVAGVERRLAAAGATALRLTTAGEWERIA